MKQINAIIKNARSVFVLLLFVNINPIQSQNSSKTNYIELDSNKVLEKHILDMPTSTISLNMAKYYEVDETPMAFVTFYSNPYIHLYNLNKDSLKHRIYQNNIAILDMEYFNNDSIMVYGYPLFDFNCDSVIRCIDINGVIKHVYPLHHPNIITSKNPPDSLLPNKAEIYPKPQFIYDNKIFMSFEYGYYGLKGYSKKYPIIGYYDIEKDTLITIDNIWYPELKDGVYYKRRFYRPTIALNKKGYILISFSYTPTFYEWDSKTNKLDTHVVASKYVTPIPFSTVLFNNEDEYDDNSFKEGQVGSILPRKYSTNFTNPDYVYARSFLLPTFNVRDNKPLYVYYDENYNYCGEALMKSPVGKETKRGYFSSNMSKGKLIISFLSPVFKVFDEKAFVAKMDSVLAVDLVKEKNKKKEICEIAGGNKEFFNYQKNDIIKYLQKTHQILDTSFSVVILNKGGCGPCNDYVLQFLEYNKMVFFNISTKPFYLLYVNENGKIEDVEIYLDGYRLYEKNHVKMDVSHLYKSFHPSTVMNPRLVLVSNNQVIHDNVYLPNEMETLVDGLLKYYGLNEE